MDWLFKLIAAVMISGLLIVSLEKPAPTNALVLSIAVTVMIVMVSLRFLEPVLSFLRKLETVCGISAVSVGIMMKCLLVSVVIRLGCAFCKDAGQPGMASALELCGTIAAVWIAVPLFEAFLTMLEGMI